MLIDCSYFTSGPRRINNAALGTLPNPNAVEVSKAIEPYIEVYQEEFLTRMLGQTLGNRMNAYLVCLEEDEKPVHKEHFDVVCEMLKESFADYVFFKFLRDVNMQVYHTGIMRLKSANMYASPIQKQVTVWNDMVERNRKFAEWCSSPDCPVKGVSISEGMRTKINRLNI